MARGSSDTAESVAYWEEIPQLRGKEIANPDAINQH